MCCYKNLIFYHIYPLGLCGAENYNNDKSKISHKLIKLKDWISHFKFLGINSIYIGPLFKSSNHGYDTIDYKEVDNRLGTNDDFKELCSALHEANIKVIVDGVFNHVGREFWAFEDIKKNREHSKYRDWFYINFNGNSNYNDGFYYEGWEGHYDLVKLNLQNREVKDYLLSCIDFWISQFKIDGLRLDVAYSLDRDFLKEINYFCKSKNKNFFLLGEIIHGDYKTIVNDSMLDSATNYECYKGIYSSLNSKNMFEIEYSLNRQFGNGGIYKDMPLYSFVDNHDVTRISSILQDENHLKHAYAILFTMPGIPSIYYGSEWALKGDKSKGDWTLRPEININDMEDVEITKFIYSLCKIRTASDAIRYGNYQKEYLTNNQLIFSRNFKEEKMLIALNIEDKEHQANLNISGTFTDLLNNLEMDINNNLILKPYEIKILKSK